MLTVGLHDSLFEGAPSVARGSLNILPKYIRFDRLHDRPITIYTDDSLDEVSYGSADVKIAWLIESPDFKKQAYLKMRKKSFYSKFDRVYTFDERLLSLDSRFQLLPFGGCWIEENNWGIYPKSKKLSIIASSKKSLAGQKLRHTAIRKYKSSIDGIFGSGYSPFESKLDVVKDYQYSIVIENGRRDNYFTEKIMDCFALGVVPIYWGCPNISHYFNADGIIQFSKLSQLKKIISTLSESDYSNRLSALEDNLSRVARYAMPEDYMYENLILKDPIFAPYLGSPKGPVA